jgi:hypothetical protein
MLRRLPVAARLPSRRSRSPSSPRPTMSSGSQSWAGQGQASSSAPLALGKHRPVPPSALFLHRNSRRVLPCLSIMPHGRDSTRSPPRTVADGNILWDSPVPDVSLSSSSSPAPQRSILPAGWLGLRVWGRTGPLFGERGGRERLPSGRERFMFDVVRGLRPALVVLYLARRFRCRFVPAGLALRRHGRDKIGDCRNPTCARCPRASARLPEAWSVTLVSPAAAGTMTKSW